MLAALKERFLTVDTRTLGAFRVCFGLLLLTNLWDRMGGLDGVSFFTNEGLWPNHHALALPPTAHFWSPLLGFSTREEMRAYMALIALVYAALTVGWRTRLMQVLALFCLESVNLRFLLPQHGGNVVLNVLAVWTVFLPLGQRYSVDALVASLRHHPDAGAADLAARRWEGSRVRLHSGVAYLCLLLNFAVIYLFNAVHKVGTTWQDGSAVHWVLWQNRLNTALAGWLRLHEPAFLSPLMTYGTLVVEAALVALILSPFRWQLLRPIATLNIWMLHGGIALLCTLGPFSYVMMCFGVLLLSPLVWDRLEARWKQRLPRRTVRFDPAVPAQLFAARVAARLDGGHALSFEEAKGLKPGPGDVAQVMEALPGWRWLAWMLVVPPFKQVAWWKLSTLGQLGAQALVPRPAPVRLAVFERVGFWTRTALPLGLLLAVGSQVLMENWRVPEALKVRQRPAWMTAVIEYLQIPQGWGMFAPDAPTSDYSLVVDATLADGSHVDVLTGAPPDFDAPLHGPLGLTQHWCEIHGRMPNWRHHWKVFRDYLRRRPELLGWPADKRVVALTVWKVSYDSPPPDSPPPGQTSVRNVRRDRLFGDEPL